MENQIGNSKSVSSPSSKMSHGQQTVGSGGWIGSLFAGALGGLIFGLILEILRLLAT